MFVDNSELSIAASKARRMSKDAIGVMWLVFKLTIPLLMWMVSPVRKLTAAMIFKFGLM